MSMTTRRQFVARSARAVGGVVGLSMVGCRLEPSERTGSPGTRELAGVRIGDGDSYISLHNPNQQIILIDLFFIDDTGVFDSALFPMQVNQRRRFDLQSLLGHPDLTDGETFTVRYHARIGAPAGPAAAVVQYVSASGGESVSTPFQTFAGHQSVFSGGGRASGQETEILSLYNPYSASDPDNPTIFFVVRFRFIDEVVDVPVMEQLAPGQRFDLDISTLTSVLSVIGRSAAHERYTISVGAFTGDVSSGVDAIGAVASLARYDSSGRASMVAAPTLINLPVGAPPPFIALDDPIYDGGMGS